MIPRHQSALEPGPRARAAGRARQALVHADALYNVARYLARDPAVAEDLVQETYERALRAWDRLEPDANVRAWLFTILRNAFLSRRRQELRRPALEVDDSAGQAPHAAFGEGDGAGSSRGGGEPEQLRRLVSSEIEGALRTLSEEARTVILLDLEGCTESEVALIVGCAVGTVKSRLNRARAALRVRLAEHAA
jgi:RNA polymerase sigma-70 factor, ECF subfamily